MKRINPIRAMAIVAVMITATAIVGCASSEQVIDQWSNAIDRSEAAVEVLNLTADQLTQSIETAQVQIAVLPDGPVKDNLAAGMVRAQDELDKILAKRDDMNRAINEARATLESIDPDSTGAEVSLIMSGEAITGVGAMAPGPVGIYATMLGTLVGGIGTFVQTIRRNKSAKQASQMAMVADQESKNAKNMADIVRNVVSSIEAAKSTPEAKAVWDAHMKPIVSRVQTPDTKTVVEHLKSQSS